MFKCGSCNKTSKAGERSTPVVSQTRTTIDGRIQTVSEYKRCNACAGITVEPPKPYAPPKFQYKNPQTGRLEGSVMELFPSIGIRKHLSLMA